MSCTCECEITYCDEIDAIRALWSQQPVLMAAIPVVTGEANRLYEDGNAYAPSLPYAVLRDVGEFSREVTASNALLLRGVRIRLYTTTKEQANDLAQEIKLLLSRCLDGICIIGGWIRYGRVLRQGSGFVQQGVYMLQLLVQLGTVQEGSL